MTKLVEVSREVFFEVIGPQNVNPSAREPHVTDWETPDRVLVGRSFPGWKNPGDPKSWFLREQDVPK